MKKTKKTPAPSVIARDKDQKKHTVAAHIRRDKGRKLRRGVIMRDIVSASLFFLLCALSIPLSLSRSIDRNLQIRAGKEIGRTTNFEECPSFLDCFGSVLCAPMKYPIWFCLAIDRCVIWSSNYLKWNRTTVWDVSILFYLKLSWKIEWQIHWFWFFECVSLLSLRNVVFRWYIELFHVSWAM